jgi:uncharacterized protein YjiS (DUF1127 family)
MKRKVTMNVLNAIHRAVVAPVVTWYNRQRMFEELNGLSDRVLADIGLTRAQLPSFVKQAYRPQPTATAADMPALHAETHPAASNDQFKQPLAA